MIQRSCTTFELEARRHSVMGLQEMPDLILGVTVHIDEARRDDEPCGVDGPLGRDRFAVDVHDSSIGDADGEHFVDGCRGSSHTTTAGDGVLTLHCRRCIRSRALVTECWNRSQRPCSAGRYAGDSTIRMRMHLLNKLGDFRAAEPRHGSDRPFGFRPEAQCE